jgi:D-alanyl-D-alanine carboxypeptidase
VIVLSGCATAQPSSSATTAGTTSSAPAQPITTVASALRQPIGSGGAGLSSGGKKASPQFRFHASALSPALRARMSKDSWHPGCPVTLDQLSYLRISYWGFDKRAHLGQMVVNAAVVGGLRHVFATLFKARFPIRHMWLVDRFGGSDYNSIQADNTSAFNCRDATGSTRWSEHAYGEAVDVDPIENPYVYANGTTTHSASIPYVNRSDVRPGMAVRGGTLVRAFASIGWGWGGDWPPPRDYQHFSINGQ